MERYAWKAIVKDGMLEEYVRRHNEIWPELTQVLNDAGIHNYTIWNVGNELFGYYECDQGCDYAARVQAESPVVDRWNEYMKDVMIMEMDPVTGANPSSRRCFSTNNLYWKRFGGCLNRGSPLLRFSPAKAMHKFAQRDLINRARTYIIKSTEDEIMKGVEWIVVHIARSEAEAQRLMERLTEEGFLVRLNRRVQLGAWELMTTRLESVSARDFILENLHE